MILQALYELANREDLVPDPDFEVKLVSWVIRVGQDGRLIGIESLKVPEKLPEGSKKKPKMYGLPMLVPFQGFRTSGDRGFFLVDKSEYALGLDPKGERDISKLKSRLKLFQEQIEQCWKETNQPAIAAVNLFLRSIETEDQRVFLPEGCLTNDLFAFAYEDDDCRIHEIDEIKAYWKSIRFNSLDRKTDDSICLITGKQSSKADKIPLLKKVPGGGTSGIALVSFNSSAFESYGWKEKPKSPVANASISSDGALASITALNRLLHPNPPDPNDPNQTLPRQNTQLSADTVVCYWTRDSDDFAGMHGIAIEVDEEKLEAHPAQIREMYKSIWKGRQYTLEKTDDFYSLVLSGGQGRATVRDWIESNTQYVANSLAQYFADLKIVRLCPPPRKGGHPENFSLPLLLESLADPKERRKEGIPAATGAQFYRASIEKDHLFPQTALHRAIQRYRSELGKETDKNKGWIIKNWNDARAAIIKAYLNRKWRKETNFKKEVTETMNPDCTDKGYVLGQLIAVLERLQNIALGDVNASIIDRYFSGASSSPKSVFGNLLRNARHHARKAKDEKKDWWRVNKIEGLIDQLCSQFDITLSDTENPKAVYENGFPAHLGHEQQGLFVLGYHQMRKWLWMNKDERKDWEGMNSEAPHAYLWSKKDADSNETFIKGETK